MTTRRIDNDLEVVAHAVHEFAVPSLSVIEFADAQAYVHTSGSGDGAETVVAWLPDPEHVAVIAVRGVSEAEALDFATTSQRLMDEHGVRPWSPTADRANDRT